MGFELIRASLPRLLLLFRILCEQRRKHIKPPMTPPAWETATGSPNNPKSRKPKNIRPVKASNPALQTTRIKLMTATRYSAEAAGWLATISKAEDRKSVV